jgi:hypothetical protein
MGGPVQEPIMDRLFPTLLVAGFAIPAHSAPIIERLHVRPSLHKVKAVLHRKNLQ